MGVALGLTLYGRCPQFLKRPRSGQMEQIQTPLMAYGSSLGWDCPGDDVWANALFLATAE